VARRRRPLRPDEEHLWQAVARSARPLRPERLHLPETSPDVAAPAPPAGPIPAPAPLVPFRIGERRGDLAQPSTRIVAGPPAPASPQMDAKAFSRLTRGKLAPEARIDLHGMTVAEAQPELIRFILDSHARGRRLVLVITGKGRPARDTGPVPERSGILRQQLPVWLSREPLRPLVLQIAEAHLKHGGGGAFYVYLRRTR
jgi:DNA-nicking Smr family endonuclease